MAMQIYAYHAMIFMLVALLVRFGGNKPIIAGSRYSDIKDMVAYNKWAGNRLLLLPVATLVITWLVIGSSLAAKLFGFMLLWAIIIAVLVWISVGARKFR